MADGLPQSSLETWNKIFRQVLDFGVGRVDIGTAMSTSMSAPQRRDVLFVLKGILLDPSAGSAASHHYLSGVWRVGASSCRGATWKEMFISPNRVHEQRSHRNLCFKVVHQKSDCYKAHVSYLRFILVVRAVGLQAVPGMNRGRQFCGRRKWSFLFGDFWGVRSSWILRLLRWRGSDFCCIEFQI